MSIFLKVIDDSHYLNKSADRKRRMVVVWNCLNLISVQRIVPFVEKKNCAIATSGVGYKILRNESSRT